MSDWAEALAQTIMDDVCLMTEHMARETIANRLRIVRIEGMKTGTEEAEAIVIKWFNRAKTMRPRLVK